MNSLNHRFSDHQYIADLFKDQPGLVMNRLGQFDHDGNQMSTADNHIDGTREQPSI